MTEEQGIAIEARMEALSVAIEHLFLKVPAGQKAREEFIVRLEQRSHDSTEGSPREAALLHELGRWKGRQT